MKITLTHLELDKFARVLETDDYGISSSGQEYLINQARLLLDEVHRLKEQLAKAPERTVRGRVI